MCPNCARAGIEIRGKLVCPHCHMILETCCEGGRCEYSKQQASSAGTNDHE